MTASLVRLVGDLYGCLSAEAPTSAALDVLCSALGAAHAIVLRTGPQCRNTLTTSHHLAAIGPDGFGELDQSDEYRQLLAGISIGSAVRITDLMPRDAILRTEMYQTKLRLLEGGLAIYGVQIDGPDLVVAAICRSAAFDADFDDDSVALLQAALPHLVAVSGIAARIERERQAGQRAQNALDLVDDGIIVLGAAGQVTHVNAAAEALLVDGDRIRRSPSGIGATERADDMRLQRAINAARTFATSVDSHDKAVAANRKFQIVIGRRTPGWPLIATVLPVERTSLSLRDGAVMLHLRDPGLAACLSLEAMRSELRLTPREAALVGELADGASLVQAAARMDISPGTARQYLKSIFLKTGVGSQADLLRLVCN